MGGKGVEEEEEKKKRGEKERRRDGHEERRRGAEKRRRTEDEKRREEEEEEEEEEERRTGVQARGQARETAPSIGFGMSFKSQIRAWRSSPAVQMWQDECGAHAIAFTYPPGQMRRTTTRHACCTPVSALLGSCPGHAIGRRRAQCCDRWRSAALTPARCPLSSATGCDGLHVRPELKVRTASSCKTTRVVC